jgi:hypothetical protein
MHAKNAASFVVAVQIRCIALWVKISWRHCLSWWRIESQQDGQWQQRRHIDERLLPDDLLLDGKPYKRIISMCDFVTCNRMENLFIPATFHIETAPNSWETRKMT